MERPSIAPHAAGVPSTLLLFYDTANKGADWAKSVCLLEAIVSLSYT